jgi:tRNA 2-thiocytidine biosynthesis protein TtcA
MSYPIIPCDLCGSQENLKRKRVKRLIEELQTEILGLRSSMMAALSHVIPSHLLDRNLFDFMSLSAQVGDVEAELDAVVEHQGHSVVTG